jgi:peptide/nickel transport system permease protein
MQTNTAIDSELIEVVSVQRRVWQQWLVNVGRFSRKKPLGAFGGIIMILLVFVAVLADMIAPFPWNEVDNTVRLRGPSLDHLAGTAQLGRDVFSRVLRGARISLWVGLGATILGVGVATLLGTISAYFGGAVDYVLQRVVDMVQSIPPLILLISILIVLGPSITNVIIALAARTAFVSSRVSRGATLSVKANPYIEAARTVGCTNSRIIWRYLLPNIFAPMIVVATINLGGNILAEASLSFLGYGVPPPEPSWGGMLSADGRRFMFQAPWMLIAPGIALSLVVYAVNMFGDAIRDVLDPRLRGS